MIEVSAFSKLKKVSPRTADCLESKVLYIFEGSNPFHQKWIAPLCVGTYYEAKEEMNFPAGMEQEFEHWRSKLCELVHNKPLPLFLKMAKETDMLFPLLSCQLTETIFGSQVCSKLLVDMHDNWNKILEFLHKEDYNAVTWFVDKYMAWLKALELGSQKGCIELF